MSFVAACEYNHHGELGELELVPATIWAKDLDHTWHPLCDDCTSEWWKGTPPTFIPEDWSHDLLPLPVGRLYIRPLGER